MLLFLIFIYYLKIMKGDKTFYSFTLSLRLNDNQSIDENRRSRWVCEYANDERYDPSISRRKLSLGTLREWYLWTSVLTHSANCLFFSEDNSCLTCLYYQSQPESVINYSSNSLLPIFLCTCLDTRYLSAQSLCITETGNWDQKQNTKSSLMISFIISIFYNICSEK